MSRLIDADRLQMELLMSRQAHKQNERENQLMERDAMIVHEQPTVDADLVEVKRCKDCRHAKDSAIHGMKYCETMQLTFDNDFYCGCGEE